MELPKEASSEKKPGVVARRLMKAALLGVFVLFFLAGYNLTTPQQNCSRAQSLDSLSSLTDMSSSLNMPSSGGLDLPDFDASDSAGDVDTTTCAPCTTYPGTVVLCDFIGSAALAVEIIYSSFENKIRKVAAKWEKWLYEAIDALVYHVLQRLHLLELDMIKWWETMWFYNLRPSMQAMTEQIHAARAKQALQEAANTDAAAVNEAKEEMSEDALESASVNEADENGCPHATVTGGAGRAIVTGDAVENALQNESVHAGYNKKGTPGAAGKGAYLKHTADIYEKMFCSPDSNGGGSGCDAGANNPNYSFYDADVQPTKFIFNRLTIPLDSTAISNPNDLTTTDGQRYAVALQRGIENIVGSPSAEPIPPDVVKTTAGGEIWMNRRAFLSRYAAARSIPQLRAGWRTPGGGANIAKFVKEIRDASGVHADDIAANPSYREIIHALTIDRFNSGTYALDQITDEVKVEQEKVRLATFTSILLRDYYELLERAALTLAVQVAVMAEQIPYPDVNKEANVRRQTP